MDIPPAPASKEERQAILQDHIRQERDACRAGRIADAELLADQRLQFALACRLSDALQDENHEPDDIEILQHNLQGVTADLKQRASEKQSGCSRPGAAT